MSLYIITVNLYSKGLLRAGGKKQYDNISKINANSHSCNGWDKIRLVFCDNNITKATSKTLNVKINCRQSIHFGVILNSNIRSKQHLQLVYKEHKTRISKIVNCVYTLNQTQSQNIYVLTPWTGNFAQEILLNISI